MKSFGVFLAEKGRQAASAGKLEIHVTSVDVAYEYAKKTYAADGRDIDSELPNFKENYKFAKRQASTGHTVRKDMPSIATADIKEFQHRLSKGFLDINKPFGKVTDPKNPFPEGLSGDKAKLFREAGLKKYDGSETDDVVNVHNGKIEVGKLKPIQKQIYVDKSIPAQAREGVVKSKAYLTGKTFFIVTKDNYIIDGHHRYLSAIILDPKLKVQTLTIDLPLKKLLPLALAYGDAIGNKRNP